MKNIIIKKPTIDDFLAISALDRVAWEHNINAQYVADGEHVWRLWVEYAIVYCAFNKGKPVGVILAFPTIDANKYFLHKIFVDYNFRGQGLGDKLFSTLCSKLDELNVSCSLTTAPENNFMLKLCKKYGFSEIHFSSSYYRSNEDRFFATRPTSA